jgi:hypothetical protein
MPLKKLFNFGRTRTQTRNTTQNGKKGNNKKTKQNKTRQVSLGADNVFNNERIINVIDTEKTTININFKTNISQLSIIDLYAKYYVLDFKNIKGDGKKKKVDKNYIKILNSYPYKSLNVYTNNILNIIKDKFTDDKQKHNNIISFYNIFARKLSSISLLIYVLKEFSKQNIFKNETLNNYLNQIEPLLIKLKDNIKFKTYDEIIYFTIHLIKDYFKSVYYLLKILSLQVVDNIPIYNYIIDYSIVYTGNIDIGTNTYVKSIHQTSNMPNVKSIHQTSNMPILISAIIGEMMTRIELILFEQFMTIYYNDKQIKVLKKLKHCLIINKIIVLTNNVIGEFNETNLDLLFDEINNLDNNVGLILPKSFNDINSRVHRHRTKVVRSKNPDVNLQRKNALQNCKNLLTPSKIPKDFKINKYYTFDKNIFNNINKEIATLHGYYNNNNFAYALHAARKVELAKEEESLEKRKTEKANLEKILAELQKRLSYKKKQNTAQQIATIAKRKSIRRTMALPENFTPQSNNGTQPTSPSGNSLGFIDPGLFSMNGNTPEPKQSSPKPTQGPNKKSPIKRKGSATKKKQPQRVAEMHLVTHKSLKKNTPSPGVKTLDQPSNNMSELEGLLQYMNAENAKHEPTGKPQSLTTPAKETTA